MTSTLKGSCARKTRETRIEADVDIGRFEQAVINTGVPFFDHMLEALATHAAIGVRLSASGDIEVDPHHLIEDCGICLGKALRQALNDYSGIQRAGFFIFPMDGSLAQVALDLCGRPTFVWQFDKNAVATTPVPAQLFREFFKALADNLKASLHCLVPHADNDHHAIEAVFKAAGRALRAAIEPRSQGLASTKGMIDV